MTTFGNQLGKPRSFYYLILNKYVGYILLNTQHPYITVFLNKLENLQRI